MTSASLDALACTYLKGVGPKIAQAFQRLGIATIQDLLFHLPLRYEDRTHFKTLSSLRAGDHVQVHGRITQIAVKKGRQRTLTVRVEEGNGFLLLRFFHFTAAQLQRLSQVGQRIQCYGEVRRGLNGYEMIHPEYTLLSEAQQLLTSNALTPVYPTTEGLRQYSLRKIIGYALELLKESTGLSDYLPTEILQEFTLPSLVEAIHYVHCPPVDAERALLQQGLHFAQQRLVFEELLAHQLSLASIRLKTKNLRAPKITPSTHLANRFLHQLPYQLTSAQQNVVNEILADLNSGAPMLRLVQGDVGSGKTVVAAVTAIHVLDANFQVVIMAPTELLAEQHFQNFSRWLAPLGIGVVWLTGSMRGKARKDILQRIASHAVQLIVGTHALFQKEVQFARLGLIVVDEQHRFGVDQRLALLNKGAWLDVHPHQLIMSATPIPRTLAMTAYADLDCSTITELPPGRMPVRTTVLPSARRGELIARIKENCQLGAQVYWVCTLIEESEVLQCQAAEEIAQELTQCLPQVQVGLIHGRMKSSDKEKMMTAFKEQQIGLLVATTVIEVGMDVPNATLMIIENPERLGLAQLHQLRGRVGRGMLQSHCVLLYQHPLSRMARERLTVMREHNDGFIIAQKDLELRGPGEVLGTRQTGLVQFKIANLVRDQHQLPHIQKAAQRMLQQFQEQIEPLIKRWLMHAYTQLVL